MHRQRNSIIHEAIRKYRDAWMNRWDSYGMAPEINPHKVSLAPALQLAEYDTVYSAIKSW